MTCKKQRNVPIRKPGCRDPNTRHAASAEMGRLSFGARRRVPPSPGLRPGPQALARLWRSALPLPPASPVSLPPAPADGNIPDDMENQLCCRPSLTWKVVSQLTDLRHHFLMPATCMRGCCRAVQLLEFVTSGEVSYCTLPKPAAAASALRAASFKAGSAAAAAARTAVSASCCTAKIARP